MRLFPLLSVCAAAVIAGTWAQAPGDEDASCLATAVASAEDVEVLMDSLNYRVLPDPVTTAQRQSRVDTVQCRWRLIRGKR